MGVVLVSIDQSFVTPPKRKGQTSLSNSHSTITCNTNTSTIKSYAHVWWACGFSLFVARARLLPADERQEADVTHRALHGVALEAGAPRGVAEPLVDLPRARETLRM
jgi:hypothetical protein